eukprot:TRINITY_DN509_c0_g1_i1.p1 TRINITY_DN509_c0_g1~~TRINITY_DN509_c0_g1_i1.p1  ORF type:complete len:961 (+),score=274.09 TRINITY_DN509_c0_g1_i1:139-3021(+)
MVGLNSAASYIALLDEDQNELKYHALEKLNAVVDDFWAEIASDIQKIEELYENESFAKRELAALVASKVYYHLGEFNDAMNFALGAGSLFDVSAKSQYVETLVAHFITEYIRLRVAHTGEHGGAQQAPDAIDPRLERIVMGMFERCYQEGTFKLALGIALEARRLDKIEESIKRSGDVAGMLAYCQKACTDVVKNREFRRTVLRSLISLYHTQSVPDYPSMVRCLTSLDDASAVAEILDTLLHKGADQKSQESTLLAYQLAFDLCDNATQQFLASVRASLPPAPAEASSAPSDASSGEKMDVDTVERYPQQLGRLHTILSGEPSIALYLEFLHQNSHSDLAILKNIKTAVEARTSVTHGATIFANAAMHAGTTRDTFLRENLEWLARATNWAKFSATAGLGVIHKGHLKEGRALLQPYLPNANGTSSSPYSEGGALYALGLIHANHGEAVTQYILGALRNCGQDEVIQHGACLGLGLAAMATNNDEVYEEVKTVMFSDGAVAGEAAGIALGLVMLGSASEKAISEMLAYAHETQHEKIIRGLAMGMALVMYGREEGADTLIQQLIMDKDPILRYGAMYTIGLAYAGTANNDAIRKILHVAVSDVSDDVRRAAVSNLGFLLSRQPERTPKMVSLLAESYNPHVRYGATLALGISCAGTALKEAVDLLLPLAADPVDFVRQGALISLALVLIQTTAAQEPRVTTVRKMFEEKIADKHEEIMCKFGAIYASGIIDAGGRNCTVSLHSRSGHRNMNAIVGVALFSQFWYWYPLANFFALALTPTALIGLNTDLKLPKFEFRSNARPSLFAYPPEVKPPEVKAPTKVSTAVLSYAKGKGKAGAKTTAMDIDDKEKEKEKEKEEASKKAEEEKKEEKKEESFEIKSNPARVTFLQAPHIAFDADSKYQPVKQRDVYGIVLLKNQRPDEPEELVTPSGRFTAASATPTPDEQEPEPPAPFQWQENNA